MEGNCKGQFCIVYREVWVRFGLAQRDFFFYGTLRSCSRRSIPRTVLNKKYDIRIDTMLENGGDEDFTWFFCSERNNGTD